MLLATVALVMLAPAAPKHFELTATYEPGVKRQGSVVVQFKGSDPDVVVNEQPAPRLALEAAQTVLVDKQPPRGKIAPAPPDPKDGRYLDLSLPVVFPVALAPGAAAGPHAVQATVTYFYCSKRDGWCRKGTSEIEIPVRVP